jgi:HPr kinase/phosphorylase
VRGPPHSGKSRLVLRLIEVSREGLFPFARLVADDRAEVWAAHGRLLVRAPPALAGLIEVHGLGIRRLPFEPLAAVGLAVDLAADDATRLPPEASRTALVAGISIPRLAIASGEEGLGTVLASLSTGPAA